jgi:hypothetical protein
MNKNHRAFNTINLGAAEPLGTTES